MYCHIQGRMEEAEGGKIRQDIRQETKSKGIDKVRGDRVKTARTYKREDRKPIGIPSFNTLTNLENSGILLLYIPLIFSFFYTPRIEPQTSSMLEVCISISTKEFQTISSKNDL
jgi:hypothetical protein